MYVPWGRKWFKGGFPETLRVSSRRLGHPGPTTVTRGADRRSSVPPARGVTDDSVAKGVRDRDKDIGKDDGTCVRGGS